jgi:hypothetical protein
MPGTTPDAKVPRIRDVLLSSEFIAAGMGVPPDPGLGMTAPHEAASPR